MLEDMQLRNLAPQQQRTHLEQVTRFARHVRCSQVQLGPDHIPSYQLDLVRERHLTVASRPAALAALRFLYRVTLKQPWDLADALPMPKACRRLPVVLSRGEVVRFLDCAPGPRYRALFATCYGTGLRASEVLHLRPTDIEDRRMVIRVQHGKGQKDRHVMLSPKLLALLRAWWRVARPRHWLFASPVPTRPLTHGPKRYNPRRARRCRGFVQHVSRQPPRQRDGRAHAAPRGAAAVGGNRSVLCDPSEAVPGPARAARGRRGPSWTVAASDTGVAPRRTSPWGLAQRGLIASIV
jgi:integrase